MTKKNIRGIYLLILRGRERGIQVSDTGLNREFITALDWPLLGPGDEETEWDDLWWAEPPSEEEEKEEKERQHNQNWEDVPPEDFDFTRIRAI